MLSALATLVLGGICTDKHPDCGNWGQKNECVNNADFMALHCPLTCKVCEFECAETNTNWSDAPLPADSRVRGGWGEEEDPDAVPPATPMSRAERREARSRLLTPPPHMKESASAKALARSQSVPQGLGGRRAWH